ncbi:MAG: CaiB/BaiF CoA transferase family protein [Nitrospinota bacterium]
MEETHRRGAGELPLGGLKVVDIATLVAGPFIATYLGDYGAEVIKVEHPRGDPLRTFASHRNGVSLWWKFVSRNKKNITLNLSKPRGQGILKELLRDADVLVENFRPGTLDRWDLSWETLHALNPRLVVARTTGFGQKGPYARRPGFGTLAESMSGFAHITGLPDGPPTLPPFALADGISALCGTFAVLIALYHRDLRGGEGQEVDIAIYEPIMTVLGAQPIVYDQLGVIQGRTGNRTPFSSPRNAYRCKDGRWVAISASSPTIFPRVMAAVGRPDLAEDPRMQTHAGRLRHGDELDAAIGGWIAEHTLEETVDHFAEFEGALAPIYDVAQIFEDPHFRFRETITAVPDEELGPVRMQNVIPRLPGTPGRIRWAGQPKGRFNQEVYGKLGYTAEDLKRLEEEGVI